MAIGKPKSKVIASPYSLYLLHVPKGEFDFKLSYLRAPIELGNKMPDLNVSGKYYSFLQFLSNNNSGAWRNLILKTIKFLIFRFFGKFSVFFEFQKHEMKNIFWRILFSELNLKNMKNEKIRQRR